MQENLADNSVNNSEYSQVFKITKLRAIANKSRLPDYKIAAECGIHPTLFSAYSSGHREVTDKHAIQLALFFKCEPVEVIGWDEVSSLPALRELITMKRERASEWRQNDQKMSQVS